MDVHAVDAQQRVRRGPAQRRGGLVDREPELGIQPAGADGGVGLALDARGDAHEHALLARDEALQPVEIVEVVDHHEADTGGVRGRRSRRPSSRCRAGGSAPGSTPPASACDQLAAARDVDADALLGHQPVDRRARERLRREHDPRAGAARARGPPARPGRSRAGGLVDQHQRRAVGGGELVDAAAGDPQAAVVVPARAGREQLEEVGVGAHLHRRYTGCATVCG